MVNHPLISCVCVTRNRGHVIGPAIASYLAQDWPNKELIIVEDGSDNLFPIAAQIATCRYYYLGSGAFGIGTKRNVGSDAAAGEFICSWDDDDWSAPNRLTEQARKIISNGRGLTGFHSMLFWNQSNNCGYKYSHGTEDYCLGTSLFYRKAFWARHPFIAGSEKMREDNDFVMQARRNDDLRAIDAGQLMVARIHEDNICPKRPLQFPNSWRVMERSEFPQPFFEVIDREMQRALPGR